MWNGQQGWFHAFFYVRSLSRVLGPNPIPMSALSNASEQGGRIASPSVGLTSDAHPEAKGSQTGESVENALAPTEERPAAPVAELSEAERRYPRHSGRRWYVLRATHNRAEQAHALITAGGTAAYLPARRVCMMKKKRRVFRNKPFFANLVFVYCTKHEAEQLVRDNPQMPYLSYYYNHFREENGVNPPLVISYPDMANFINATIARNEHTMMLAPGSVNYKKGDMVRVTEGDFKDVRGRVARVAGQTRVVVEVKDFGLIATAYIPAAFLESVE